jgi:hypothetical protein
VPSAHAPTRTLIQQRARAEEILRVFGRYGVAHMTTRASAAFALRLLRASRRSGGLG